MNCGLVGRGRHRGHKTECLEMASDRIRNGLGPFRVGWTPSVSRSPSCEPVSGSDGPSGVAASPVRAEGVDLALHGDDGRALVLHRGLGLRGMAFGEESLRGSH